MLVRSLLGQGSMGRVYRTVDSQLGIEVALKTLHRISPENLFHLKREFRVLAGLSHPNLVRLYELFVGDREMFFTMELVDGEPLVEYVRRGLEEGDLPDPAARSRLFKAFRQVAEGLSFLHRAGRTHGDVKPSNVLVAADGRAVVLDFGLTTQFDPLARSPADEIAGTLAYVAPECLVGEGISAASDWYGFGATLYQARYGQPPFAGSVGEILLAKSDGCEFPPPAEAGPIEELIAVLLSPRAVDRPSADDIMAVFAGSADRSGESPSAVLDTPFVDREEPLAGLMAFYAQGRDEANVTFVRGASGIGKSELISRFAASCVADGALVLKGRCRHQESITYRALDAVVDELSSYLLELDDAEVRRLVPRYANALLTLFPVLARVPSLSETRDPTPPSDDEAVRRAFVALRDVLAGIAERRPLIIWVDDAQWGDRGSVALLRGIVRGPDSPRISLIVSYRREDEQSSALLSELRDGLAGVRHQVLDLEPLSNDDSRELVQRLVRGARPRDGAQSVAGVAPFDELMSTRIVDDASGSPFFLIELVRRLVATGRDSGASPDIERILHDRMRSISPQAQRIMEFVATAGRPCSISFVLEVAGLDPSARTLVLDLCAQSLLRTGASAGEVSSADEIETYHDRIREVALGVLPRDRLRDCHRKLAEAIRRRPAPDAEQLVEHFLGAEENELAAEYAVLAATAAEKSLRFDRAAEFYALALRLRDRGDTDWEMQRKRADALANAGRGAEAADVYMATAQALGRVAPNAHRQATLVGLAAEHYLYSGHATAGVDRTREVMRYFGVNLPATSQAATWAANLKRLRFLLTFRAPQLKPRETISAEAADRLQALFGTAKGTALLFPKLSDFLGMYYLREALRAGDAEHIAIAIAKEASIEGALPGPRWRRRAERLLDMASAIGAETGAPHVVGTVLTCRGAFHYFSGQWDQARQTCEEAIRIFRNECVGHQESSSITFHFLIPTLAQQGDIETLARILPEFDEDARRRGDLTAANVLEAGDSVLVKLAQDLPQDAIASADELIRSPSGEKYSVSHYHHLLATTKAALYMGDPQSAWNRVEAAWQPVKSIGLLTFECYSAILKHTRGGTALACAAVGDKSARRLVRIARSDAAWLNRSKLPHAAVLSASLRAGIAALEGNSTAACGILEDAAVGFADAGMPLHASAARIHMAHFGAASDAEARDWMTARGIRDPQRMARAIIPFPY